MHWERACVNECVLPNNQADSPLPGRLLLDKKAVAATKVAYPEEGNASFGKPAPVALKIGAQNRRNKPPHPTSPAGSGPTSVLSGGDPEPVFRRIEKQVFYNSDKLLEKHHLGGKGCHDSVVGWCSSRK